MGEEKQEIDMYDEVCSGRFDDVEQKLEAHNTRFDTLDEKIDNIFNRLFVTNGKRAMVELINDNKMEMRRHKKDEHAHGDQGDKDTEVSIMRGLFSAKNMNAVDIFKMGMALLIIALLAFLIYHVLYMKDSYDAAMVKPIEVIKNEGYFDNP